ncbi:Syntaxin of plants 32 isoform 1 [Theobroma cacao]|uniref:Syntaxin of plants 32 isoform 1 n=1 Tax=Theobroma cacao TaxID=3641 RepID=A0A061GNA4_THECC|nr:Syntaxin of plants 32 isoform 1 [Theobroma cacao]
MPGKSGQSSYRDRTQEFLSVAETLKKSFPSSNNAALSNSSSSDGGKTEDRRSAVAVHSEFNKRASKIGFGIHQTSQKLANLAKLRAEELPLIEFVFYSSGWYLMHVIAAVACLGLQGGFSGCFWVCVYRCYEFGSFLDLRCTAGWSKFPEEMSSKPVAKRTSVFDDPTAEIQELTSVIKQDITALNSAVVDLQLLCNSQNESGNISSDTTTHSTTVVDNLKNRLMSTTKEFKEVLTMRTENIKVHENRRQLFSSNASKDSTNPFIRQRPLATRSTSTSSSGPPPWANGPTSSSQLFPSKLADGDSQPLLQQQHQQQQHQQLVPLQDSYMQSRAEALHNVESTIHELSNIFTQLATMVSQQGELAIRIDENMDESLANVEGAQSQLVRYLNSISSNRLEVDSRLTPVKDVKFQLERWLVPNPEATDTGELPESVNYACSCSLPDCPALGYGSSCNH